MSASARDFFLRDAADVPRTPLDQTLSPNVRRPVVRAAARIVEPTGADDVGLGMPHLVNDQAGDYEQERVPDQQGEHQPPVVGGVRAVVEPEQPQQGNQPDDDLAELPQERYPPSRTSQCNEWHQPQGVL